MGYGLSGHLDINDDLNQDVPTTEQRKGYIGGGEHGINDHYTGPSNPNGAMWDPTGGGEDIVNGYKQGGTSAYDKDVANYRAQGAQGQSALTLNQANANQSRGMQMGALGLMQGAAQGNAPSRAAALGQASTDSAIRQQMANAGAARGPGAAIAAMHGAQAAGAQQMGAANQAVGDMRAREMAAAQQDYAHGAQGVQAQDIGAATTNAQLEAQQRALNEKHQQANERLAFDTRHTQLQNSNEWINQQQRAEADRRAAEDAAKQQDFNKVMGYGSMAVGGVTGVMRSDERSKQHVVPVGSLSSLGRY